MRVFILSLMLLMLWGCYSEVPPIETDLVGKKLPSFNILGKDSTVFNTQQIPEGQSAVFFYFSPNCPYCRAQFEDMKKNIDDFKNTRIYMLTSFPYNQMMAYYKKNKLDQYPNIVIGQDTANYFAKYFEVSYVPATAIYDKEKKLNSLFMGQTDARQIIKAIEQ